MCRSEHMSVSDESAAAVLLEAVRSDGGHPRPVADIGLLRAEDTALLTSA